MEILSYGGGIQTVALAILNVMGKVGPRAEAAVMSDTGAEMPGTYAHVEIMHDWLKARGMTLYVVQAVAGSLETYVREKSTAIPVRLKNGIGHRQCTLQWKAEVIAQWLAAHECETATVQLGISVDEYHRMKASPTKWITHRYPLVDMRLTRADCRKIIEDAGLPVPPKSACYFCPFHRHSTWQNLAVFEPELFEKAAQIEDVINARRDAGDQAYLSSKMRPLRQAFSTAQMPLDLPEDDDQCGGYCFL